MTGLRQDEPSPYALAEKGLFIEAAAAVDTVENPPLSMRVLRAQLTAHLTSLSIAREQATQLLQQQLTLREKADCWELIGRSALKGGQLEHGLRAMNRALEAAVDTRQPIVEARIRARVVAALLYSVSVEAANVEMPKLRQLALRAGDGVSLTDFHLFAAAINVRCGHYQASETHLKAARGLLQSCHDELLRGRFAVISSATLLRQSNYREASIYIEEALDAARRSGSKELLIPSIGNYAILTFAQGKFDQTRQLLDELTAEVRKTGNVVVEINIQANALDLAIAQRNLKMARAIDDTTARIMADTDGGTLYHLGYLLSRVRLLFSLGDIAAGLSVATNALPLIHRASDLDLLTRMKLVAAEGLSRMGESTGAANLLVEAASRCPTGTVEIVAEVLRVTGLLAAKEDRAAAKHSFEQAARILDSIGNVNARDDVRREMQETVGGSADVGDQQAHGGLLLTSQALTSLQLCENTPLFARELLAWVASSDCFLAASITETDETRTDTVIASYPSARTTTTIVDERIALGTFHERVYELRVATKPSTSAKLALLAVHRLAQIGAFLARAKEADQEWAAVWPTESTEKQLGLICSSDRMKELIRTIRQVADSNVTVLLTGETGVGKELFAKALHQSSPRSDKVFLPFNCSTVPRDMFDSHLFGHKRGSFTGAVDESKGVIRAAAGGTLFLDEIGEMTIETQPKLLRFLESGEILPLGESKPQHVDVRIVAATNADLDQLVADGRFREDLYYRLNVIRINIPPLRERREEIPALVEHFLERFGRELHKPMLRIADETLEYLVLYRWPGNVRQLANEIRRLVAMAEPASVIMPAHLSDDIAQSRRTLPANRSARLFDEVITRIDQPLSAAVEHIERAAIQRALSMTDGRLDEAARMLGLSRKGLYLKRQRLNLG